MPPVLVPRAVPRYPRSAAQDRSPNVADFCANSARLTSPTLPPTSSKLAVEPGTSAALGVCIVRRMPRMQVYLPDELYEQVKTRHLPASELLQAAVRAEVRRQDLLGETDAYLADLFDEVGQPSQQERARAQAMARRIASRRTSAAS
jgi:post-segregation antitoxin (ccd killing protein)